MLLVLSAYSINNKNLNFNFSPKKLDIFIFVFTFYKRSSFLYFTTLHNKKNRIKKLLTDQVKHWRNSGRSSTRNDNCMVVNHCVVNDVVLNYCVVNNLTNCINRIFICGYYGVCFCCCIKMWKYNIIIFNMLISK